MVNFAIIGTGFIAAQHAKAIKENPNAALVAVCDMNGERAAAFAADEGLS